MAYAVNLASKGQGSKEAKMLMFSSRSPSIVDEVTGGMSIGTSAADSQAILTDSHPA